MDHSKAHPAEAATRENALEAALLSIASFMERVGQPGDVHPAIRERVKLEVGAVMKAVNAQRGKCFECGHNLQLPICPKCNPEFDLSTHQQQGDYAARLFAQGRPITPIVPISRAPQPDTVTEERLREILAEVKAQIAAHAEDAGFSELVPHGLMTEAACLMAMKRAAALAAKGK